MIITAWIVATISVQQELPPCVRQYDDMVEEPLQRFLKLSCDVGGDVKTMVFPPVFYSLILGVSSSSFFALI